ncbi:hypothetical protein HYC85_012451 [Camellia sinensis]|uniref:Uncharacterized protein n=1 Tax=Camellia sinensis TaxID=4442 RepID=A0A7J7HEX3_CAMSI|nr:hypothetical protein HYC85_012451 [Camellia sinensis]
MLSLSSMSRITLDLPESQDLDWFMSRSFDLASIYCSLPPQSRRKTAAQRRRGWH